MATGTHTFGLDETLIEPRVLEPPPTRHALLIFLVVLASILHFGTAGWSAIQNGVEGYYAAAAQEMVHANTWAPPPPPESAAHDPPLVYWATLASYKMLGPTASATRIPGAFAFVLCVALTFLIGERLAGYWRGFLAGLIQLCWLGSFTWGRIATAEPLWSACIAAAIYCAIRGYQQARHRRLWFAGVWASVALACLTKGAYGFIYPAVVFLALALMFREARLRLRLLLDWRYVGGFLLLIVPLYLWSPWNWFPPFGDDSAAAAEGLALPAFLGRNFAWWFPAVLLVIPGALFGARKIFRPHEFEFADALPLCWAAVGFLPFLFFPGRHDYHTMSMWSALALWIACAWQRTERALRLAGIAFVAVVGCALAASRFFAAAVDRSLLPAGLSLSALGAMPMLIGLGLAVACLVGGYFAWHHREELAIGAIMLAMVPIGLSAAEAMARFGSFFSFEDAASFLRPRLGESGQVLFEGRRNAASSLRFYLQRDPVMIDEDHAGSPDAALSAMAAPHPVYLIVHRDRVPYWQRHLTERFHIYHQATTCGAYVVINNDP